MQCDVVHRPQRKSTALNQSASAVLLASVAPAFLHGRSSMLRPDKLPPPNALQSHYSTALGLKKFAGIIMVKGESEMFMATLKSSAHQERSKSYRVICISFCIIGAVWLMRVSKLHHTRYPCRTSESLSQTRHHMQCRRCTTDSALLHLS